MRIVDELPLPALVLVALLLGLAPYQPEPHLVEKLRMLFQGTLRRPIDVFDLIMHGTPVVLVGLKIVRLVAVRRHRRRLRHANDADASR